METTKFFKWGSRGRSNVESVFMVKVFYFWSGRNAWNCSWSRKYPGINAFHLKLGDAKNEIEKLRVQGSTWTIQEMPAIALVSKDITLIVCEINTKTPFSDYRGIQFSSIVLKKINKTFLQTQIRPNSIQIFATKQKISPAYFPFCRYKSYSHGVTYLLEWLKKENATKLNSVYKIIGRISKLAQREK